MGQGSIAYESYVRIHEEMGNPPLPTWQALSHVRRMAWEAAAQAVARAVLPTPLHLESFAGEKYDDEDYDDNEYDQEVDDELDVD